MYLINACDYICMQKNKEIKRTEGEREKYFNRGAY